MKTKLLRKVRKRYSIEYFPYGTIDSNGNPIKGPLIMLSDKKAWLRYLYLKVDRSSYDTAYAQLQDTLMDWILYDYKSYGTRRNKKSQNSIKLWYK